MHAKKLHRSAVLLALAATAACTDVIGPAPGVTPDPDSGPGRWNALGLVEVTLTDLGSSAPAARAAITGAPSYAVSTIPGGSGNGSIQLRSVSSGSFTVGTRAGGGHRYVYSTFQVRNAASNGTPYDTDRNNLTLLAVATPSTLNGTAVSRLSRYDGSAANAAIALGVRPTGAVAFNQTTNERISTGPDVLQVYDEGEVASVPVVSGGSVLPWGFVVSNPSSTDSRTLPAAPAANRWDGLVTFAFKVPLQPTAAEDPFTVSFVFIAVDDPETRLTLSPEEQTPAGAAAALGRAGMLGAGVTTLARYPVAGATRTICSVRVAGPRAAPTATLFPGVGAVLDSLLPGPARLLGRTARLGAAFDCPVSTAPAPASFVVHGSQSGRWFLGGGFTGAGTRTIQSPQGAFLPGEEVEVTLTPAFAGGTGYVRRYRVTTAAATGAFQAAVGASSPVFGGPVVAELTGDGIADVVVGTEGEPIRIYPGGAGGLGAPIQLQANGGEIHAGDMDGDGDADLVVEDFHGVTVLLRSGSTFTMVPGSPFALPAAATEFALSDMNADGRLDVVFTSNSAVNVVPGAGDGTLVTGAATVSATSEPQNLAVADLNGDGRLDAAVLRGDETVSLHLGNGEGGFSEIRTVAFTQQDGPRGIGVADVTGDGFADLVVGTNHADAGIAVGVHVLPGNGTGGYQNVTGHPISLPGMPTLSGLSLADVDGDGRLDIVVAGSSGIQVLLRRGDGWSLLPGGPFRSAEAGGFTAAPGDLTGDGRVDLAMVNLWTSRLEVLVNR